MKQKLIHVALIIGLGVGLVPLATPLAAKEMLIGPRIATVIRVVDGDTIIVETPVWLGLRKTINVRLAGIDTPELRGKCDEEKDKARQAKDALVALLTGNAENPENTVQLFDIHYGSFAGRVVAKVVTRDGADIAQHLLDTGHARRYHGGKRQSWCD